MKSRAAFGTSLSVISYISFGISFETLPIKKTPFTITCRLLDLPWPGPPFDSLMYTVLPDKKNKWYVLKNCQCFQHLPVWVKPCVWASCRHFPWIFWSRWNKSWIFENIKNWSKISRIVRHIRKWNETVSKRIITLIICIVLGSRVHGWECEGDCWGRRGPGYGEWKLSLDTEKAKFVLTPIVHTGLHGFIAFALKQDKTILSASFPFYLWCGHSCHEQDPSPYRDLILSRHGALVINNLWLLPCAPGFSESETNCYLSQR